MKRVFLVAALASAIFSAHAADRELQLPEQLQQGQLVVGHAPKGAKIEFAGRRVLVGDDGVFVFGLGRDAPAEEKLHIRYSNGKASDVMLKIAKREYETERVNGLPQQTVTPNPELTKRIERERARCGEECDEKDEGPVHDVRGILAVTGGERASRPPREAGRMPALKLKVRSVFASC